MAARSLWSKRSRQPSLRTSAGLAAVALLALSWSTQGTAWVNVREPQQRRPRVGMRFKQVGSGQDQGMMKSDGPRHNSWSGGRVGMEVKHAVTYISQEPRKLRKDLKDMRWPGDVYEKRKFVEKARGNVMFKPGHWEVGPGYGNIRTSDWRPAKKLSKYVALHPWPNTEPIYEFQMPGEVDNKTRRERRLRDQLVRNQIPPAQEFDEVIQRFAQRARQEVRWLALQRRFFLKRAKIWANEMMLADLEPSTLSFQLILLACGSLGDIMGAQYFLDKMQEFGQSIGRVEYNAVIAAFGTEGRPKEAERWMERMRDAAGLAPDARTIASIMEGWEKLGNRHAMLKLLSDFQEMEADGKAGEPLNPQDAGLPYFSMARSYMRVGDVVRAVSILKHLQISKVPLHREAHRIRLEAHMRVPQGPRRDKVEIERAFRDYVAQRPRNGPLYTDRFAGLVQEALGMLEYQAILKEMRVNPIDLEIPMPEDEAKNWRKAMLWQSERSEISGLGGLRKRRLDLGYVLARRKAQQGPLIGQTPAGFRVAATGSLPEWLTAKDPVKFGR